ncbi:MAG: hypothetical protein ACXW3G_12910 [Rhodoplanes sp.]
MMKRQGGGAIVNVASVNGLQPGDKQGITPVRQLPEEIQLVGIDGI